MRSLNEYITLNEGELDYLRPTSKRELIELIKRRIRKQGYNCDLNDIDVSKVTDMSSLFSESSFNGDISKWDTSSMKISVFMFIKCNIKEEYKPKSLQRC